MNRFCPKCFEYGEIVPVFRLAEFEFECPIHGYLDMALVGDSVKKFSPYDQKVKAYNRHKNYKRSEVVTESHYYLADNKIALQDAENTLIETNMKQIISSNLLPKDLPSDLVEVAARAAAILAVQYGIDIRMQQAYIASFDGKTWQVVMGYRGVTTLLTDHDSRTGDYHFYGPAEFLSPEIVAEEGAHKCSQCGGTGKVKGGNCYKCNGNTEFDPKDCVMCQIAIYSQKSVELKNKVGMEIMPDAVGVGVWQPWENIPKARTKKWVAEKRARNSAANQVTAISLTVNGQRFDVVDEDDIPASREVEDLARIKDEMRQYQIYGDFNVAAGIFKSAIDKGIFSSVEEIIEALNELESHFEGRFEINSETEVLVKQVLLAYSKGWFPFSNRTFVGMDQVDPILRSLISKLVNNAESLSESVYGKTLSELSPVQLSNLLASAYNKSNVEINLDTELIEWKMD